MDPYCIFGGHILSQYFHGSVVYWSATMLSIILSMGMPTPRMIYVY
jgi:hypothetical protein